MSVLIKGMEMPTSCGECWFCHAVGNDKWHCRLTDKSFSSWEVGWGARNNKGENGQHPYVRRLDCPLVPVPPHGDLIEESKVLDIVFEWCPDDDGSVGKDGDLREMLDEIEALPTIIPAEEGEK